MKPSFTAGTETVGTRRVIAGYALIFGVCALFILINTTTLWFSQRFGWMGMRESFPWALLLLEQITWWLPVALLASAIPLAGRRFRLERRRWLRMLPVHLGLSLVYAALTTLVSLLLTKLFGREAMTGSFLHLLGTRTLARIPISEITYWSILGAGYAFEYYRRFREQQLQAAQLEAQLAQAQLEALKMQLHPHFLFNTLHAISALMEDDVRAARRMIARLSELLRLTLENAGRQEVPLSEELDALRRYLEIEQIRFQDRLKVRMQIDPALLEAAVPNLILQPIVENAIRHGIAPSSTAGLIEISAQRNADRLELQVRDDGPGLARKSGQFREGIGLANTRARLRQLYGETDRLEIASAEGGGVIVKITIPFQKKPAANEHEAARMKNGSESEPELQ
ncbi:MAG TPA: histidine kinase [Blastocatellia bacterium]|nr:histidine kinase [Blastocatellia bacterium]